MDACALTTLTRVGRADERSEAMELLAARVEDLGRMSWSELDALGEREEWVLLPSGRRFRVVTGAFWDMDEWRSGMELYAKAYATSGWRQHLPYAVWGTRGGPDDPVPTAPRR